MASIYTLQDKNVRKTWLLMAVFVAVIVAVGFSFSYIYDAPEILWVAIVFSVGMNIFAYWNSDKIALKLSGAVPVVRSDYPDLWNVTENLAITAGLPMPTLYLINDPAPNAFATGRDKEHAAVAVTSGLLQTLNRTELEGVIAHELSHIGNRDILLQTVVVVLVGFIAILSDMFIRVSFWGGGRSREGGGGGVLALIGIVFIILSPIIATLIQLAISRKREFLADASGALLTRYPEGLASALEKIHAYTVPMRRASTAMAHLYIANPFGVSRRGMGFAKLFLTHPPVQERINALRGT
ncbi:M48 family metallopeptidase [Candidatus Wolfebacteria bacterium]|nr:M48 family metallopeptidase [Candidatus Wolfebacteria bacterium]